MVSPKKKIHVQCEEPFLGEALSVSCLHQWDYLIVVFLRVRRWVYWKLEIRLLLVVIIVVSGLLIRSCSVCIIGLWFTKLLMITPSVVIIFKENEVFQGRKNSHLILFWGFICSMFWALNLWVHLWVRMGWNKYFLWLTMYLNRLKLLHFQTIKEIVSHVFLKKEYLLQI